MTEYEIAADFDSLAKVVEQPDYKLASFPTEIYLRDTPCVGDWIYLECKASNENSIVVLGQILAIVHDAGLTTHPGNPTTLLLSRFLDTTRTGFDAKKFEAFISEKQE